MTLPERPVFDHLREEDDEQSDLRVQGDIFVPQWLSSGPSARSKRWDAYQEQVKAYGESSSWLTVLG